jgi:parallel beta-helix repeat protein
MSRWISFVAFFAIMPVFPVSAWSAGGTVLPLANYQGQDWCERLAVAVQQLPVEGGTIDARMIGGPQSCSSDPFAGVQEPVTVLFGPIVLASSASWEVPSGTQLIGAGKGNTEIRFDGIAAPLVQGIGGRNVRDITIESMTISSDAHPGVVRGLSFDHATDIQVRHNLFTGLGQVGTASGKAAIFMLEVDGVTIEDNDFTNNGSLGINGNSDFGNYDVVVGYAPSSSRNVVFRGNRIWGSHANISVALFDVSNSVISGNAVDQNNQTLMTRSGIVAIRRERGQVMVTTAVPLHLRSGVGIDTITISGVEAGDFNGTAYAEITVLDPVHFTYQQAGPDDAGIGGTLSVNYNQDGYGIMFYTKANAKNPCDDNRVISNTVSNTWGTGIYLQGVRYNTVSENVLRDTQQGQYPGTLAAGAIVFGGAPNLMGVGNQVTNNTIDLAGTSGIEAAFVQTSSITGNSIRRAPLFGIRVRSAAQDITISHNEISDSKFAIGIEATSKGLRIEDNVISRFGPSGGGIFVFGVANDTSVTGNKIAEPRGSGQAIIFMNSAASDNSIERNTISGTAGGSNAIDYRANNGRILGNIVQGSSGSGIAINSARGTLVSGNRVEGSGLWGIDAHGPDAGNTVRSNDLKLNRKGDISGAGVTPR